MKTNYKYFVDGMEIGEGNLMFLKELRYQDKEVTLEQMKEKVCLAESVRGAKTLIGTGVFQSGMGTTRGDFKIVAMEVEQASASNK